MVELDQFRYRISGYDKPMAQIKNSLDLDNKQKRIEELEADMESPGFWDNPDKSQNAMKELKGLKDAFERYNELETGLDDVKTLIEMAEESNDQSLIPEIEEEITGLEDKMESLRIETLLSGEHDACDAILTLHAGAGGTESCDWCQMLFRMYTRWAESHGYTTETLDYLEGEEAGIKSVDIQINDDDLRIDTYRSSGAGGQHINKTSSAIRITHLPTGIVVQCQNERSQHQNKDKAMQMLKAKLYLLKEAENAENLSGIRGDVKDINFGSQIRSYVLQPYTMVKDNRTNKEVANAGSVLDGNIDPFINAYLTWISTGKTEE